MIEPIFILFLKIFVSISILFLLVFTGYSSSITNGECLIIDSDKLK